MRIAIFTLGCKTNQYESELIRESFEKYGDEVIPFKEKADVYIINSCVVTHKAESETKKAIRNAFRRNPNAKIILTSCYANLNPSFHAKNLIVYRGERSKLADFIYGKEKDININLNLESINRFFERTRAIVKIEEGCNNFCTYCIIPLVRGNKIRSKSPEVVVNEIQTLAKNGFKEIVLTGTEIGKYGEDIGTNLALLLSRIKRIPGIERIRISSIYPTAVNDALIEQIEGKIVPHLHLSLQSGDNTILKKMNRNYTVEEYMKIIEKLRKKDPLFSITTDIIVGFPGETEEAFLNSMKVINSVEFAKVHVFRFSKRPFTPAFFMDETVSENTKKLRAQRISEFAKEVAIRYKKNFIGKTVEVLTEEETNGFFYGFTPRYLRVKFTCKEKNILHKIMKIKISAADSDLLYGNCIE